MENNNTTLEKFNPASLQGIISKEALAATNAGFAGGISTGDFLPQISLRGNRFRLKVNGEETVLKDPFIEVFLVTSRSNVSKTFYAHGYNPAAENNKPDCSSADGVYPDANIESPQSTTCQLCPNNAWGSKISVVTGKKSKACSDYKLLVLALSAAPDNAFTLRVPAASLRPFASYISKLNLAGIPANAARTRISLGDTEYPSLQFDFVGAVESREMYERVTALAESADVLNAVRTIPHIAELPTHTGIQPVAVENVKVVEPEPSLTDLIGMKPTAPAKTPKKKAKPSEPEPEDDPVSSLDALLEQLTLK